MFLEFFSQVSPLFQKLENDQIESLKQRFSGGQVRKLAAASPARSPPRPSAALAHPSWPCCFRTYFFFPVLARRVLGIKGNHLLLRSYIKPEVGLFMAAGANCPFVVLKAKASPKTAAGPQQVQALTEEVAKQVRG